jgi:hypothetical protein
MGGDIGRKIGQESVEAAFALPLARASEIRDQQQRQRRWKLFPYPRDQVHRRQFPRALRVRRQGADRHRHRPCLRRPVRGARQGLPGNPYDGHTLRDVIGDTSSAVSSLGGVLLLHQSQVVLLRCWSADQGHSSFLKGDALAVIANDVVVF